MFISAVKLGILTWGIVEIDSLLELASSKKWPFDELSFFGPNPNPAEVIKSQKSL